MKDFFCPQHNYPSTPLLPLLIYTPTIPPLQKKRFLWLLLHVKTLSQFAHAHTHTPLPIRHAPDTFCRKSTFAPKSLRKDRKQCAPSLPPTLLYSHGKVLCNTRAYCNPFRRVSSVVDVKRKDGRWVTTLPPKAGHYHRLPHPRAQADGSQLYAFTLCGPGQGGRRKTKTEKRAHTRTRVLR